MTEIPVIPVPKPRMTQRDKWQQRPSVMNYREYKDRLNSYVKGELEPSLEVRFEIPMPLSWSKKKRMELDGTPHQQKPDIDNLIKGFLDALCEDDSYVYDIKAKKYWSEQGKITIWENI